MKKRRQYTNEELGINPARENRIIRIVVGTMVVLLVIGMLAMFFLLTFEASRHEEPVPEQPFMEFSMITPASPQDEASCHG